MGLQTNRARVTSRADGHYAVADVARCGDCDCKLFFVFQIEGQLHFHLQCHRCGQSYCPDRQCSASGIGALEKGATQ